MQAADRPDFEHETSPAGVIALLGMPCDLGGGRPGPVMSPMALGIAGLPETLAELGFEVIDQM